MLGIKWYKEQGIKNPLRRLTYTIIGIFIFIPAFTIIFILVNMAIQGWNPDNTYYFGVRPTLIVTDSMEPVIQVNSLVLIEDVEFKEVNAGDIIRYNSPQLGYSIVHRVVAVADDCLYTQGDNNPTLDRWPVYPDMLNGRVVEIDNNIAPYISLIIGEFDIGNIGLSIARMAAGFLGIALGITFILLGCYYSFEIITINYYWRRKKHSMINSLSWMDERQTTDRYLDLVDRYTLKYNQSNIFKRIVLALKLRKLYDVMCTEEKHVKRVLKYTKKLEKSIGNIANTEDTDYEDTE